MKFAVILLAILALACMAGSFITQGQTFEWYESAYSQKAAAAILFLGLDDVFHCWWFVVITAFLCLNLLLCNVLRLGTLLRRWRAQKDPAALLKKIQIRQAADPEDLAEVAEISSVLLSVRLPFPDRTVGRVALPSGRAHPDPGVRSGSDDEK